MHSLFLLLALVGVSVAQTNLNLTVNVGGWEHPITSPQVMSFNSLNGPYKHVIILSIDGFHQVLFPTRFLTVQVDLATYVAMNPQSTLATLLQNAVLYNNARTSMPSDSHPGTTALYTGALPRTHGIWYDTVWNRALFGEGCTGPPGYNVRNDETIDANSTALDGGGAFDITQLSWRKTSWGSCAYLLPHSYLRTSTIFEVVRNNGGFTKLQISIHRMKCLMGLLEQEFTYPRYFLLTF
jgi:Type I phosphodiesterase / nucleotide pyrophosphatase